MKHYLIVDGNSLAYVIFTGNVKAADDHIALPFVDVLRSLLDNVYPLYQPIVLWDGGSQYRKSIYPEYKGQRAPKTEEEKQKFEQLNSQRADLMEMLSYLNIRQYRALTHEADDLAYQIVKRNDAVFALVTEDKDWFQLLRGKQDSIYRHRSGKRVTLANLPEIWGLNSKDYIAPMKALIGDPSDNIPGVGGIGEKTAVELLNTYGSVFDFVEQNKDTKLSKALQRLVDNKPFVYRDKQYDAPLETYKRNLKLVDLSLCPPPSADKLIKHPCLFDLQELESFGESKQLKHWPSNLNEWSQPFQRN